VAELAYLGIMTPGEITLNIVRNDPADNRYLECAVEGAADYLVSGDQDLLDLHEHSGIRIVRPRTFLEAVRSYRRPASQED
jgi:predicted nucleic acid-binding protein